MIHYNIKIASRRSIVLIILLMLLNSCSRDRHTTGWDYFPDMFYSIAYETYSPNPNFADGMTMREPVPGTVPRGYIPFEYTIELESRIEAGKELRNPLLPTADALARGKEEYTIFCSGCHGVLGDGKGFLFTSGLYPLQPKSLTDSVARNLKEGEIFHTITLGRGFMGAHGAQVAPDDRWKIILYIRQMQEETLQTAGAGREE